MDVERPDTTPGYEMESPSFTLTFVTGLQRGVASSMLEMETDWYVTLILLLSLVLSPLHALLSFFLPSPSLALFPSLSLALASYLFSRPPFVFSL